MIARTLDAHPQELLWRAIAAQDVALARQALDAGADVDAPNDSGHRPVENPVSIELLTLFVERGAELDFEGDCGSTLLSQVVDDDPASRQLVEQALLKNLMAALHAGRDADLERDFGAGLHALDLAIDTRDTAAALELLARGARSDSTPVLAAVWAGLVEVVDDMVKRGADVGASQPDTGWTPLHLAVRQGHVRIAELLLAAGASVDPLDSAGRTPMFWATSHNNRSSELDELLYDLLARHGANPNPTDRNGWTPMHVAVDDYAQGHGTLETIAFWLARGVDPAVKPKRGPSPLEWAAQDGLLQVTALFQTRNR